MRRIPNNYSSGSFSRALAKSGEVTMLDDELASFMSGQTDGITSETERKFRQSLLSQDAKTRLFMAAYGQKSIARMARLMIATDNVEVELLQPWRIKSMDSKELTSLYSELNRESTNTLKTVVAINDMGINGAQELDNATQATSTRKELTPEQQGRVARFMQSKVITSIEVKNDNG